MNKKQLFFIVIGVAVLIALAVWLRGCGDEIKKRIHNPKPFNALAYLITKNNKETAIYLQAHKRDSLFTDSVLLIKNKLEARYKKSVSIARTSISKGCDSSAIKQAFNDCDSLAEQNNRALASQSKELADYAAAVGSFMDGQVMRDARHIEDSTSYAALVLHTDSLENIKIPKLEQKAKRNFKLGAAAGTILGASAGYGAGKLIP